MLLLATLLHKDTLSEKAGVVTVHSSNLLHSSKFHRRRRAAHWIWEGTIAKMKWRKTTGERIDGAILDIALL